MKGYHQDTYGEQIADIYDKLHPEVLTSKEAIESIAELANGGSILELGVGTGRLAIPLAKKGFRVTGIDISPAMLTRLAENTDGFLISTVLGDFAELNMSDRFDLVVVAADTFFMLTSQEQQVRCFATVAKHLAPGGVFVIEAFMPDRARATAGGMTARKINSDSLVLGASTHDPANQRIDGAQILIDAKGVHFAPASMRYAWPTELDLMARLGGLHLKARWGGWNHEPFGADTLRHVSVYQCP